MPFTIRFFDVPLRVDGHGQSGCGVVVVVEVVLVTVVVVVVVGVVVVVEVAVTVEVDVVVTVVLVAVVVVLVVVVDVAVVVVVVVVVGQTGCQSTFSKPSHIPCETLFNHGTDQSSALAPPGGPPASGCSCDLAGWPSAPMDCVTSIATAASNSSPRKTHVTTIRTSHCRRQLGGAGVAGRCASSPSWDVEKSCPGSPSSEIER